MGLRLATTIVAIALSAGAASAAVPTQTTNAKLTSAKGKIQVDSGKGWKVVKPGATLPAGARILVPTNSSAVVAYGPQGECTLELTKRGVFNVPTECKKAAGALLPGAGAAGAAGATILGAPAAAVGVGLVGVVAAGTIIGVAAGGSSGDGTPVSDNAM